MRVLVVSQYFSPERTAAALRLGPLVEGLARLGHDVDVVCELPSHPEGRVQPGYGGRPMRRFRPVRGVRVDYVWTWARPSKRTADRLLSYATYAALGAAVGSARRRPDVVIASSPPLSVGAVGLLLARRFRVPFVFDVRDLWPDVALALGELREGAIAERAGALERRLYEAAAAITVPTGAFAEGIAEITEAEKVHVLSNGTTRDWLAAGERAAGESGGAGVPFSWTYAGNVGLSQRLDVAIRAAGLLGVGFRLVIVGDGASRERLQELARSLPAADVAFVDPVDPVEAAALMARSDALLVPLADDPVLAKTIPVKLYDACAVGRPVIVAAPGEAQELARAYGAGLIIDPYDPTSLAAAVRRLREEPDFAGRLAAAGLRLARASLREDQVPVLESLLQSLRSPPTMSASR